MKHQRHRIFFILLALLVCFALTANAQYFDNKGKDFLLTYLPNYNDQTVPIQKTELHLTAEQPVDSVHIKYPAIAPIFETTVSLTPGVVTIVEIPLESANGWPVATVTDHAVHVYSQQEFICYMINRETFTTDAALALPVDVMNTEYIVITYEAQNCQYGGEFAVVAAYDNTEVTITPTKPLMGGHPAGTPFTITLDAMESYMNRADCSKAPGDLTGTLISSNKPIGMTNGNRCITAPPNVAACDHVFEVAQPVQTWGVGAYVTNLPLRPNGTIYRVVSAQDDTDVYLDDTFLVTLDKGEFYELSYTPDSHIFSTNNPDKRIFVAQFMTGQSAPGAIEGDPAMGNMTPAEQYLSSYTFSTIGGGQFDYHFLSVIAHGDDVGTLELDGVPIDANEFSQISNTDFYAAVVELNEGTHTTYSSNQPHGITVEGYASYDSYIFPGGAMFAAIPSSDTTPPMVTFEEDDCILFGEAVDMGDTISGINQMFLDTASFNLELTVDQYTPGDTVVTFKIELIDHTMDGFGGLFVYDLQGNLSYSEIMIEACEGGEEEIKPTNQWINVYCGAPQLNGEPLMPGDTIRAYDPDGVLCGMDVVRNDGKYGLMPIYHDDMYSEDIDEGCETGDTVQFTINGEEVYTDPFVIWTANGDNFETCLFSTCRVLQLEQGWNLISWNKWYQADIEDMLDQMADPNCLGFIQAFDQGGLTYDPMYPQFSTLHHVDFYHGYWFYMECATELEICGPKIPVNEGISIYSGWNLISYWPADSLPVDDALYDILDCVIVVLGWDTMLGGQTWLPNLKSFVTLTHMKPWYGYWVKSSCNEFLNYPGWEDLPFSKTGGYLTNYQPEYTQSSKWMSIFGEDLTIDGHKVAPGASIEAYTTEGVLCGKSIYDGSILKFTPVYGNDGRNESAKLARSGDKIAVFIDGKRTYPDISWNGMGGKTDISDRFSARSTSGSLPVAYKLEQNYPNPFNPTTTIAFYLERETEIKLEVYNIVGQKVAVLAEGRYSAGNHQVVFDGRSATGEEVASGIYFYRLTGENINEIRKMTLMR